MGGGALGGRRTDAAPTARKGILCEAPSRHALGQRHYLRLDRTQCRRFRHLGAGREPRNRLLAEYWARIHLNGDGEHDNLRHHLQSNSYLVRRIHTVFFFLPRRDHA